MYEETNLIIYEGVVVPESALLKRERSNKYGGVPDLDTDELAETDELERMVYKQEFGPVLALPVKGRKSGILPAIDEDGKVDWGAFASADFDTPKFDKLGYKVDKMKERLKDLAIMLHIINDRIPGKTKYKLLRLVRDGIINVDDISDWDTWQFVKLFLDALWLKKQIEKLQEKSRQRREQEAQKFWDSFLGG